MMTGESVDARHVDDRGTATGPRGDAWQLLVDSASDAYVSIDAAGTVTHWNASAVELFGWTREEALGRLLSDLIIPPEFREAHLRGLQRFVAAGRGEVVFQRLQLPALHRAGRRVDVEFTILPVEDHETGWHFHAFLRDVTAELAQQRYVRLLEQVALAANEATAVEEAVRACLQAAQQLTGSRFAHAWLVDDSGGIVPTGWWTPEPPDALRRATAGSRFAAGAGLPGRVVATGAPAWVADIRQDANFPRAGAAIASDLVAAFAFPVVTQDRPVAVIELFRDETGDPEEHLLDVMRSVGVQLGRVFERERAFDEVLRLAADREAIVAIVGHELRGPLTTARAAAGILVGDRDHDEPAAAVLERQLGRLHRLVDMFLTAQHLESGSLAVHPRPIAVARLAREVISDGDFDQVDVTVDDDVEVLADPDHVAQMLWNLIGNASRHGVPPIRISAERSGPMVAVTVADAGPGVPPDVRPRLFERFARGSASRGTGLGLSIVHGLARSNGGDASYVHAPPAGPAFVVQLPPPEPARR